MIKHNEGRALLSLTCSANSLMKSPIVTSGAGNVTKCDHLFSATVKPKVFKKLQDAQVNFPMWVAAIADKLGNPTAQGFVLDEPNIQVFEKKPKEVSAV